MSKKTVGIKSGSHELFKFEKNNARFLNHPVMLMYGAKENHIVFMQFITKQQNDFLYSLDTGEKFEIPLCNMTVGLHLLQMSYELAFKALLAIRGIAIPKHHNLMKLLNRTSKEYAELLQIKNNPRMCSLLKELENYIDIRYCNGVLWFNNTRSAEGVDIKHAIKETHESIWALLINCWDIARKAQS